MDRLALPPIEGVDLFISDTDKFSLDNAKCGRRIQLGASLTQGLSAGTVPEIGRAAAEESLDQIFEALQGVNILFITAGMGGGTGTGAGPVFARAAREHGILTVGVVTKPFAFEGMFRMHKAESGIQELQQYVDTLIIIPNQNLFRVANEKTTFADAFNMADDVLHSGVRVITELMATPDVDFAHIRAAMTRGGKAAVGAGEAEGEARARLAADAAISNPLLDDVSLSGAKALIVNVTGGSDLTLFEVDEAVNRLRDEVSADTGIVFRSTFDERLEGRIAVSFIAAGMAPVSMPWQTLANLGEVVAFLPSTVLAAPATVAPTVKAARILPGPAPDNPARPPAPLSDLAHRRLPIESVTVGTTWLRIHSANKDPLYFGPAPSDPPGQRFDAPGGEYRVMYLGQSFEACFVEKFLRVANGMLLPREIFLKVAVSVGETLRPLRLVRLLDDGLFQVGATSASINGDYALSRQWALALFEHPDAPDGLLYRSRWNNAQICIALFERSPGAFRFTATEPLLTDEERLAGVLQRYGVGFS